MKEIVILRHGNWNLLDDRLTDEGKERCKSQKPTLGAFTLSVSSPAGRAQETARLLSGLEPQVDSRAGILRSSPELGGRIAELRKTHPFGVAGAIISIPELREPLREQGQALVALAKETIGHLEDGQRALIISHDGTMVAAEKVLTGAPFDAIDHTFGELEGFKINEDMEVAEL